MQNQEFERFLKQISAAARQAAERPAKEPTMADDIGLISGTPDPDEIMRFGPFELLRELGSGGFGVVFLARDTRDGETLALKLPMPHVLISQSARNRFRREGRVGAVLDHPGIVKMLETGEAGRIFYIASEYVPGPTLSQWLKERTEPVPVRIAASIVARMAEAVAHAHALGVIHRDLKPANVILKPVGGSSVRNPDRDLSFQPCLTDFGLARVLHEIRDDLTLTGSAEIGSAAYMAPEQAVGQSDRIGPWTDIHALGAILFRMIAGVAPFQGDTREELLARIARDEPPLLRAVRPDVPKEMEWICDQCMRKSPWQRYASAESLAADLDRFLGSESIQARPLSAFQRLLNWVRRHPAISAAALASFVFMQVTIVSQAIANRRQSQTIIELNAKNRDLVESQRREQELKRQAEAREALAERSNYATRLRSAGDLAMAGNFERAQKVLREIEKPPGQRDFAWAHLNLRVGEEMEVLAFENHIRLMAISPDGRKVASLGDDGHLSLREIATGREIERHDVRGNIGQELKFSRDGRKIFALLRRIDEETPGRSESGVITVHESGGTRSVSFLCQASQFVESAAGDRLRFVEFDPAAGHWEIRYFSIENSKRDRETGFESATVLRLLPDGRHAVVVDDAGAMRLKSLEGEAVDRILAQWPNVRENSLNLHPTRAKIAWIEKTGGRQTLNSFDADTGESTSHSLTVSADRCVWIENDDRLLIYDETWKPAVFESKSGKIGNLRPIEMTKRPKLDLSKSELRAIAKGDRLLTYGAFMNPGGFTNQLWDIARLDELHFLSEAAVGAAQAIGDTGSILLLSSTALKRWWPEPRQRATRQLDGHTDEAWGASFSPDGATLATSGNDTHDTMTVRIWDWKSGKLVRGFAPHKATVSCVEFSPDGNILATCALAVNDNLSLWNSKTGDRIAELAGHESPIYAMVFSEDGTRLATGDNAGNVIVWDVAQARAIACLRADTDKIRGLGFSHESNSILATASESRRTRMWETTDNRLLREWVGSNEMTSLAFVAGKPWLCAAQTDGSLIVWNTETGERIRQMDGDQTRIEHIRYLPESGALATGDDKGIFRLWDLETGIETIHIKGHEAPVRRLATTPDGQTIATVAHDGSVRLWFSR